MGVEMVASKTPSASGGLEVKPSTPQTPTGQKTLPVKEKKQYVKVSVSRVSEVLSPEKNTIKVYKANLGYKNWRLMIMNIEGSLRLRIYAVVNKKVYRKVDVRLEDVAYLKNLMDDLDHVIKSLGVGVIKL